MLKRVIQNSAVITDGNQTVVFRKWETGSSKKGNRQLIATFTPKSGAPVIKDYFVYESSFGWAKLQAFMEALGFTLDGDLDENLLTECLGMEVDVVIMNEPWNGVLVPKVACYGHTDGTQEPAARGGVGVPLAPILSRAEQEEKRRAIQESLEEKAESDYRTEMQSELGAVNQGNGQSPRTLGDLQRQRATV
jgi:hypothetical protein